MDLFCLHSFQALLSGLVSYMVQLVTHAVVVPFRKGGERLHEHAWQKHTAFQFLCR